ncbi:MAG TPA: GNAT family N-acetyltransferase [Gemmatimonadaceae bacterium]|nr:GNAT family N-acetyltransferase [Gemmatimonadaceae bacterium]
MTTAASRPVTRIASLAPAHRASVERILRSTARFRDAEVDVALELFDAAFSLHGVPHDPDYHFLGAFDARGALVGFVTFGPTPQTRGTWDLYWIAVAAEAQGLGAGRALLDAVEARVAALGARLLLIETSSRDDYERTRRFYAARGYAERARIRGFYAPDDDRLMLTKTLR